jgi:hypothetical protein
MNNKFKLIYVLILKEGLDIRKEHSDWMKPIAWAMKIIGKHDNATYKLVSETLEFLKKYAYRME